MFSLLIFSWIFFIVYLYCSALKTPKIESSLTIIVAVLWLFSLIKAISPKELPWLKSTTLKYPIIFIGFPSISFFIFSPFILLIYSLIDIFNGFSIIKLSSFISTSCNSNLYIDLFNMYVLSNKCFSLLLYNIFKWFIYWILFIFTVKGFGTIIETFPDKVT